MSDGLSFACPHRVSNDYTFQRFLNAAPEAIYNPWPELAGLKSYEQARSQPLLRSVYVPSFNFAQGRYDCSLDKKMERLHEELHIYLDYTPAKTLARLLLIPAYINLQLIMDARDWNSKVQKCWTTLKKLNSRLLELFDSLSLSEELLVTALSFHAARYHLKIDPASLMPIEQRHVAYLSKFLRPLNSEISIESLYYGTFKKLAEWIGEKAVLGVDVFAFVQGIRSGSEYELEEVDTKDRIKLLHENIQSIKDGHQLVNWLTDTQLGDDIEAWHSADATLLLFAGVQEIPWAQCLWTVTHGKALPRLSATEVRRDPYGATIKATGDLNFSALNHRIFCMLYFEEVSGKWYLRRGFFQGRRNRLQELQLNSIVTLLALDSIRQQLMKRKGGFFCPNYTPGKCLCGSPSNRLMVRLSQWAQQGKFGRWDDWKDLPLECRS